MKVNSEMYRVLGQGEVLPVKGSRERESLPVKGSRVRESLLWIKPQAALRGEDSTQFRIETEFATTCSHATKRLSYRRVVVQAT